VTADCASAQLRTDCMAANTFILAVGGVFLMEPNSIRVVIADDHPLLRMGICKLLEATPEIDVVGQAENGQEAIQLIAQTDPDVLILDLQMPVMDGIQVMDQLKSCGSRVRILILSAFNENQYISEVLTRGAWGYYLKEEAPSQIVEAVRQASRGDGNGTRPRPSKKLIEKLVRKLPTKN
jgi:DNA-binding NarL/FixJ family response regulator